MRPGFDQFQTATRLDPGLDPLGSIWFQKSHEPLHWQFSNAKSFGSWFGSTWFHLDPEVARRGFDQFSNANSLGSLFGSTWFHLVPEVARRGSDQLYTATRLLPPGLAKKWRKEPDLASCEPRSWQPKYFPV